jgi:formylglycine-generating enzyme required for sulfatase activity
MVKIPGGNFKSGKDRKPASVKEFRIDKMEVTFAQYKIFDKNIVIPQGKNNYPVSEISYFDAKGYCKSMGKRLPTMHEWEKAARGDDGRKYPWGNKFDPKKANTQESGFGDTVSVGSFKDGKSPYGVMDMTGNVWEWVDAWASEDKKYRLVMGGSFFDEENMNTAYSTLMSIPDDIHTYIGFRCAK